MNQFDKILSIIIPVYNVENYIKECLDSLLKQDLSFCEILCVNDGSTDDSLSILNTYQVAYPNLIKVYSQKNKGQAVARNMAIEKAQGKYITFLDSDDYYLPNAIETIKNLILKNKSVDVFYVDCAITSEEVRYYTLSHNQPVKQSIIDYYDWEYKNYNTTPAGCVWGGIYKRDFINKNNLRMHAGVYYEDELFVYSLFTCQGEVIAMHLEEPYYFYRTGREGSTVTLLKEKNFRDRMVVTRQMNNVLQQSECITLARKHKVFSMYLQNIIEGYQNGFLYIVKELLTKEDFLAMQLGAISKHERKLLKLLKINLSLMAAYKTNQLPNFIRRFINVFIK